MSEALVPLRRNRGFALFTAGQMTSNAGSALLLLAVLLHVYAVTRSTRMTTVAFLAETVPAVALSPWAGAIADRLDRRRILIVADVVRALLLVPLLVSVRLAVLIPVLAAMSMVQSVFRPAEGAFVPALVPAAQLARANGLTSASYAVLALACPPLGGALFAAFGFPVLVVIDMATFVVSVLTLAAIRVRARPVGASTERTSIRRDIVAGARLLGPSPVMRLLVATGVAFALLQAFVHPTVVPYLQGILHATAPQVGFAVSAQGAGTLACGLVVTGIAHRFAPPRMFALGCIGLAMCASLFALAPSYVVAVLALALMGVPGMLENVATQTLLQTRIPDAVRGRALGFYNGVTGLAMVAGAAVPAFAVGALGIRGVVVCAAGASVVGAVVAVAGLRWFRHEPDDLADSALPLVAPSAEAVA